MSAPADRVRAALRAAADPARAPGQQAYMKSAMPFLGVRVPEARRIAQQTGRELPGAAETRALARELWDDAAYREERYAAMGLLRTPALRGDLATVALIEHMVRTGQWWDVTDELAARIADLHDRHPAAAAELARTWSTDPDLWLRRVAILSQLGRRERVDRELLAEVLAPNLTDHEFFIRKAIGWALRDLARHDPGWVRAYADRHPLSPLSRREALKHLAPASGRRAGRR